MSIFGMGAKPAPKATPVTPRLSDAELAARDEAQKTKKRMGLEDQVLSRLGKPSTGATQPQYSSLLGRTAA